MIRCHSPSRHPPPSCHLPPPAPPAVCLPRAKPVQSLALLQPRAAHLQPHDRLPRVACSPRYRPLALHLPPPSPPPSLGHPPPPPHQPPRQDACRPPRLRHPPTSRAVGSPHAPSWPHPQHLPLLGPRSLAAVLEPAVLLESGPQPPRRPPEPPPPGPPPPPARPHPRHSRRRGR